MDGAWLVIPVKPLASAKTRLGDVLSAGERLRLARSLTVATFEVVARARTMAGGGVAVVTSDVTVAEMAGALGWPVIPDPGIDHAAAMVAAGGWVADRGGSALITVATDLPGLAAGDIDLLSSLAAPRTLVLGPNRSGRGTNALAVAPPRFPFSFGLDSFPRHVRAARGLGMSVRVLCLPGLAADLDEPGDLALLGE